MVGYEHPKRPVLRMTGWPIVEDLRLVFASLSNVLSQFQLFIFAQNLGRRKWGSPTLMHA